MQWPPTLVQLLTACTQESIFPAEGIALPVCARHLTTGLSLCRAVATFPAFAYVRPPRVTAWDTDTPVRGDTVLERQRERERESV